MEDIAVFAGVMVEADLWPAAPNRPFPVARQCEQIAIAI